MRCAAGLGLSLMLAGGTAGAAETALQQVVATERAFAARAQVVNARQAFVEFFAPDAILYRPFPEPAFPRLAEQRGWALNIQWRPVAAGVSAAGDLGWTTGPAEYRRAAGEAPTGYGHYASVWRREADGRYKVVIDIGTEHGAPPPLADWAPDASVSARATPVLAASAAQAALLAADGNAGNAAALSTRAAVAAIAHDELRVHLGDRLPAVGRAAALAALDDATLSWAPEAAVVAVSGDFGYSYGRGRWTAAGSAGGDLAYLNLWQWNGSAWQLTMHVSNRVPPAKQ